jgi:hypothetical protein
MLAINAWITRHPAWFERSRIDIEDGHEGWRQLIDDAFTSAEKIVSDRPGAIIEITQVKEKLGALIIYFRQEGLPSDASIRLREIMHAARARSLHVCEICGAQAHLGGLDSCLSVRCPLCAPAGWVPTDIVERGNTLGNPWRSLPVPLGVQKGIRPDFAPYYSLARQQIAAKLVLKR